MAEYLTFLLHFQRFIVPAMLGLLAWAVWRTAIKRDIAIGLGLYLALVVLVDGFYNTGIYIPGFAQGSIKYSEVCAAFVLAYRPTVPVKSSLKSFVLFLVTAYFLLLFFAALRATPVMSGMVEYRRTLFPQIVALAIAIRGLPAAVDYRRMLLAVAVLAMVVGLFSLWDVFFNRWLLHSDMLFKPEYGDNRKNGRFGGVFLNPNYLGAFVVLVFPPLFVQMLHERVRWARAFLGATLLALIFCLVETQSRAPLLAFGGALALLALGPSGGVSRTRRIAALLAGLMVVTILMPGFFEHASKRFQSIDSETSVEEVSRASVWQYTKGIIADHALFGIGLGEQQFLAAMARTDFRERYGRTSLDNPHNSYLQVAVYAGIPTVAIFVFANVVLLWKALRVVMRPRLDSDARGAIFGLAVGVTSFLISIYPDMHLFTQNVGPLYWLYVGLLLSYVAKESPKAQPASFAARLSHERYGKRALEERPN